MNVRIRRPSPSLIVSLLALLIAMTGTAVAVTQNGDSLVSQRSLSGNRLRLNTVTDKEVANLEWHNLNLINGWTNYNAPQRPPAWALDAQGILHLRGAIWQLNGKSSNFARLPSAVRPSVDVYLATDMNNVANGRISISPDGHMYASAEISQLSAAQFTSLDGITWAK